jgi:hypothetical protein
MRFVDNETVGINCMEFVMLKDTVGCVMNNWMQLNAVVDGLLCVLRSLESSLTLHGEFKICSDSTATKN